MLSTYRARHNRRCYPDSRHGHWKHGLIRAASFAVSRGHACHKQATMPHMTGEEKEVPLALPWFPSVRITSAPSPTATTIRLNPVIGSIADGRERSQQRLLVHAPTVSTFSASPGGVIFFQDPIPELPALHTSTIPLSAICEA